MRITSSVIRGAVLTAAVAMVPSVATAATGDMWLRNWTLCVQGTFSSCHSVQLQTTDLGSSTAVVVRVRNLSGQDPLLIDNSIWSGLGVLRFYGSGISVNAGDASPVQSGTFGSVPTATTGGASNWNHNVNGTGSPGLLRMNGTGAPDGSNRRIGGCNPGSGPTAPVMFTCGGQIVFSFATQTLFTASQMDQAYIRVDIGLANGGAEQMDCQSSVSSYSGSVATGTANDRICGIRNTQVTFLGNSEVPEPMTVALLGSGLVGIAGAGIRRRRKTSTEE